MKYVKFIITIMVVLLCFTVSSELFQLHLQTFSSPYFFIDIENEDRSQVYSLVVSATDKYHENVFSIERKNIDAFHSKLILYADEDTQEILFRKHNISSGEFKSLFSGSTEVVVLPFEEVINNNKVVRYYFTGKKDTVVSIRQNIYLKMATSYVHKEKAPIHDILIYGIWIITLGFILLLTWIDIQYSQKHDFLRISMGESVGKIILEKILTDVIFNVLIFSSIYVFLKSKIFMGYKCNFVYNILALFFLFNSVLYLTLIKVEYKEVIYGANINGKLLINTYLLQAVVEILMIVSLSSNLESIQDSRKDLAPCDTITHLSEYNSISITPANQVLQNEEKVNEVESDIYLDAYLQNKVLLSTFCAAIHDEPVIVLNEEAVNNVVSDPKVFEKESYKDFVVYIPEKKYAEIDDYNVEFAVSTTAENFFGLENYSFEARKYSHTEVVYFDIRNVSDLPLGADMISDPVIVYCNLSDSQIREMIENNAYIDFGDKWVNVLFNIENPSFFSEKITEKLDEIQLINVSELCNQYRNKLIRGVLLNSIFSVFLFVLTVLLISVITKIEYLVNSKELALKKIFGYSILQRNAVTIAINIFSVFIAFITGAILSEMYSIFNILTVGIVSLLVLSVNCILILISMIFTEKNNTIHILKGGSL